MEAATGEWLTFVDADDRISPDHLARYVEGIEQAKERPDIVVGGYVFDYAAANTVWNENLLENGDKKTLFETACHLALTVVWNKMFSAELARSISFDPSLTYAEDALFCMKAMKQARCVHTISMTGYRYQFVPMDSANGHYHSCMEAALASVYAIQDDIYRQIGMPEEEISKRHVAQTIFDAERFARNIFRRDSPLSLREQHGKMKSLIFDNPLMPLAIKSTPNQELSKIGKLIKANYRLHSPWLTTLMWAIAYRVKQYRDA